MTGEELLNRIDRPFEEPFLSVRQQSSWPDLANPLHLSLLFIDFNTEVCMNGMLGFLENLTGAYLNQTIDAFRLIGAEQTASALSQIRDAMHRHSVSYEQLRGDFEGSSEYEISSFSQLHPGLEDFTRDVAQLARSLYIHDSSQKSPYALLEAYLEQHSVEMLAQLESIAS